jgi:hypothetical protein
MDGHDMPPLDEFARLWNDTRSRMQPSLSSHAAWSWPLAAAAGSAMLTLIGTSSPGVPTESQSSLPATPVAVHSACQEQTWPYLSDTCLQRDRTAVAQAGAQVRVLSYEPAMADAAIGTTPWALKDTPAFRPPQGRKKQDVRRQANHGADQTRTVTVRSGRNATSERVYVVPSDTYRAYGYVPR